jgi:hypothetical protein
MNKENFTQPLLELNQTFVANWNHQLKNKYAT